MNINNKEKQFAGGNWSSNKFTKEHTEVKPPAEVDEVKYKKARRDKKPKKPYIYPGDICPYCKKELPDDLEEMKKRENQWRWRIYHCKVKICPHCGAYEVDDCPACHRSTWYRAGWYKHQWMGCGFEGKRKI